MCPVPRAATAGSAQGRQGGVHAKFHAFTKRAAYTHPTSAQAHPLAAVCAPARDAGARQVPRSAARPQWVAGRKRWRFAAKRFENVLVAQDFPEIFGATLLRWHHQRAVLLLRFLQHCTSCRQDRTRAHTHRIAATQAQSRTPPPASISLIYCHCSTTHCHVLRRGHRRRGGRNGRRLRRRQDRRRRPGLVHGGLHCRCACGWKVSRCAFVL